MTSYRPLQFGTPACPPLSPDQAVSSIAGNNVRLASPFPCSSISIECTEGVAWHLSRCKRAVTYQLEMSGSAEHCAVIPTGVRGAGDREACVGGGRGNMSSLGLCWEILAFISNNDELKLFVRICQNMSFLQHAVLRPVSRTVTL